MIRTALLLTLAVLPAAAGDWPRFHGNAGGTGPEVKIPGAPAPQNTLWKIKLPGTGCSSPVISGDHLYVTAADGDSGSRHVLCYSTADGKELWRVEDKFTPHGHHKFNSFASSTPAADAAGIYLAWTSGGSMRVLALDHSGKARWNADLGAYQEDHGSGASPVVVGDLLIVTKDSQGAAEDSFIAGLRVKDGSIAWKTPRKCDRTPFSTPLVHTATDGPDKGKQKLLFSSNPQALTCIDPATGKVDWQVDKLVPGLRAVGSPAHCDGTFYATTGQGGVGKSSVAVQLKDGKPEIVWESKKGMPYVPTPAAAGKQFYFLNDGGLLGCVNAADGKELWNERVFDGSQAYASPVIAGDRIYCVSRKGTLAVARTGEQFEKLGEFPLGEPSDATPALSDGKLFIRTESQVFCFGAAGNL